MRKRVSKYLLFGFSFVTNLAYTQPLSSEGPEVAVERFVKALDKGDSTALKAACSPLVTAYEFSLQRNEFRKLRFDFPVEYLRYSYLLAGMNYSIDILHRIVSGNFVTQRERVIWAYSEGNQEMETNTVTYRVRDGLIRGVWIMPAEPDPSGVPSVPKPTFSPGKGPTVHIDEAHFNNNVYEGSYWPFAELLRRDGYDVRAWEEPFTRPALDHIDILVIPNAMSEKNANEGPWWSLPTPSAFTPEEVQALRDWVQDGGSLLLIADHMPFPGAAKELAAVFGATFYNGVAKDTLKGHRPDVFRQSDRTLISHPITRGRNPEEWIDSIGTWGGQAFQANKEIQPLLVMRGSMVMRMPKVWGKISKQTPTSPVAGWLQGGVTRFGKGRVALFGDGQMFSILVPVPGRFVGQNAQFTLNVMHWLTGLIPD